jgi:hypothetical protein
MPCRNLIGAVLFAALSLPTGHARAWDDAKYPNWKGQWLAINPPLGGQTPVKFDPTKAAGPAQQAPLTPEYQKVLEDSMADQAKGGLGNYPTAQCHLGGMPRTMASRFLEFIITQDTTYVLAGVDILDNRRIYTDGRDWPTDALPTSMGYSIGKWIDETGSGRFDVLEVDTRAAPSRDPAPTTQVGCHCTSTISRHSKSGFISTRAIQTSSMTKSRSSITL